MGVGVLAVAAAWVWAASPPRGERKAVARVITRWDSDCDGSNRADWDNMVDAWYDEITNDDPRPDGHGAAAWVRDGFHVNGNIVDSDFADPDKVPWGNDFADDRLDEDDVCMVGLHGGETSGNLRWRGRVRVDEPPDGAGDPNCNAYQGHMTLGNTDLEFLHMSSCHSLCQDNWTSWQDSFARLHQLNGFHGIMYIVPWWPVLYEDFGDDVFDDPIYEAWLDNLYDPEHWYEVYQDGDQCPTSMASGSGLLDAWDRLTTEQYNNVFADPQSNSFVQLWVSECDPYDDAALPP